MAIGAKPHALLRPSIALPFLLVAIIWGSTWLVIKDQLDDAPVSWSVTYRFVIAGLVMFVLAYREGKGQITSGSIFGRLHLGARGQLVAIALGITQFFGNFNFVYRAEIYLTSGIVAVMFALLMVPNAIFGRLMLGSKITARFAMGTLVAFAGIALLMVHEARTLSAGLDLPDGAIMPDGAIILGIGLAIGGILSASFANVLQAGKAAKAEPLTLLLAWAMAWGVLFDGTFAFFTSGPPVFPDSNQYWAGIGFLAILGSVVTFPLYFKLIREMGPGRAAYNGVLVPVVAMALSTLFEGYQWTWLNGGGAVLAMIGLVIALRGREMK